MKKTINQALVLIGVFLSYFRLPVVGKALRSCRDKIYSGYLRRSFSHMGHSFVLWHPHSLIGAEFISIGDGCTFESGLQLAARNIGSHRPRIVIGNNCLIRHNAHITAIDSIIIGDNLLTGTNVFITDNSHGESNEVMSKIPPVGRPIFSKGPVKIGNNVWLGNNVCILPGVTIGDGVIVGANSVVTKSIPNNAIAAGVPAKIIKQF